MHPISNKVNLFITRPDFVTFNQIITFMRLLIMFLVSVLLLSSCSLAIKRANRLNAEVIQHKYRCDAVIVPGVPLKNGMWDSTMKARVLWSVYLYRQGITKNIIYSGAAVYTPFYEAVAMGLYAQQLGVPAANIFYDTLAKHSTENVFYSYKIAKKLGFKKIALATDPFQSALLNSFTRKRFMSPIQHIPVDFEKIKTINQTYPYIDSMLAFKPSFESILAQESFFKRLRGTMGKQINFGTYRRLGPL